MSVGPVAPGRTFTATIQLETGLVGTLKLGIYDGDTVLAALSAASINEIATTGIYVATRIAPDTSGQLVWSLDGTLDEDQVYEEDLIVSGFAATIDPASDAFATPDDLAARLGLTFTVDEETRASTLLVLATGLIQDAAKQTILEVAGDVLTMPGTNDNLIKLPERPVTAVASVTLDSATLVEGTDWYLRDDALYRIGRGTTILPSGLIDELGGNRGFGSPRQTLTITYTHGYADDALPASVKAICLEAVVRVWVNPGAAASSRVGDTYDSFSAQGLTLTDDETRTIRKFFGRRAHSIAVA